MTFSEYFNALFPYLSGDDTKMDFLDEMIGHFVYEEAQDKCEILNGKPDTKRRYVQEKNPNKIKPEYAQYAYSKHNPQGYKNWLDERMFQQDTYDKIEKWLGANHIEFNDVCDACDELLENILFEIAYPSIPGGGDIKLPEKDQEEKTEASRLTENDRKLLKDFHIDFDSILEKFITNGPAGVILSSGLSEKIDNLYSSKWKERTAAFEDIELQSEILSTIATLKELCGALDPDSETASGSSVRRLRIKLRNNYVRLHPDNYVDIFPYEAFVDDWSDGEEYDF